MLQELIRLTESPKGQLAAKAPLEDIAPSTTKSPAMTTTPISSSIHSIIDEQVASASKASGTDNSNETTRQRKR